MTAPDFLKVPSGYDFKLAGSRFFNFSAAFTRVTGDVTLDRRYRGGVILFDAAAGGTITVPATLGAIRAADQRRPGDFRRRCRRRSPEPAGLHQDRWAMGHGRHPCP
ncbi:hypothetical protein [Bradyrhizobium zhanjiangense]|uniref:hypothetical protein n=1 Tax=Bradyrhizobium zhanjiangense TaxID=1325107 RepID=UPI001008DC60|nr:hypothetical protein [Bradyrhizobium zhanjiangense]